MRRRGLDDHSRALVRQVTDGDVRPVARGGRVVRPRRRTSAAVRYRAAARSRQACGDRTVSRAPPVANPAICIRPPIMLNSERPVR
ncbi:hypothetical protein GCM10010521_16310 [Streptomyces rameus]|uniref:Uncharacterized protein n=1 Tax=Streptomyces rameus TaxID=68261 RepID=A0ABP6MZ74_9ACTN